MAMSEIIIDTKQLNKIIIGLHSFEKEMPGAAASALNRTVDFINTKLGKIITTEYAIKVSDIKMTIKKNKAKKGELTASLSSIGGTLSFSHFKFTPTRPGIKRNVKVKIKKNEGSKNITTEHQPFVLSINGHINVFKRTSNKKLPIIVLRTLSVPQMIENIKVEHNIQDVANKKLEERIEHEIEYRLNKIKVK